MEKKIDLSFADTIKKIENIGKEEWVPLYSSIEEKEDYGSFYCGMIDQDKLENVFRDYCRDIRFGDGRPGTGYSYDKEGKIYEYYPIDDNCFLFYRTWSGKEDRKLELSQEFVLYYDLYLNSNRDYLKIHDDGEEEIVIRFRDDIIEGKLKYIKEYISIKKKCFLIFFDFNRFVVGSVDDIGVSFKDEVIKRDDLYYSSLIRPWDGKINSWILGKRIIFPIKDFSLDVLNDKKEYEKFFVGIDENGKPKFHTCEESKLANFFGANPDSPQYLTPVCFKKEVLKKYYDNPHKYSVSDGTIQMHGFWFLRIDNNQEDKVVAFLGDLGRDIPYKEQKHWKNYEILEQGKLSHVQWQRSFMCEFCDSEVPDLFFKQKYASFNEKRNEKFGRKFFNDLGEDKVCYKILHSLTSKDSQTEFEEQVRNLVKIFIDALNEKKIAEGLVIEKKDQQGNDIPPKGIDKLECFIEKKGYHKIPDMIRFLRNLQGLRSSCVAHLKGREYNKTKAEFSIGKKSFGEIFDGILINCIQTLNTLENRFLKQQI